MIVANTITKETVTITMTEIIITIMTAATKIIEASSRTRTTRRESITRGTPTGTMESHALSTVKCNPTGRAEKKKGTSAKK